MTRIDYDFDKPNPLILEEKIGIIIFLSLMILTMNYMIAFPLTFLGAIITHFLKGGKKR